MNGQTTYIMYSGGTTEERFLDALKNVLISTLYRSDIIAMYNMRSHHVKGVKEAQCAPDVIPLYLPSYSSVLNPIEMMWPKMKDILRKWGIELPRFCPNWSLRRLLSYRLMTA